MSPYLDVFTWAVLILIAWWVAGFLVAFCTALRVALEELAGEIGDEIEAALARTAGAPP